MDAGCGGSEGSAEVLRVLQEVSAILLQSVDSVSEHLEFWEELHKAPRFHQLTSVLFRRGPLPFLQSVSSILVSSASHLRPSVAAFSTSAALAILSFANRLSWLPRIVSGEVPSLEPDKHGAPLPEDERDQKANEAAVMKPHGLASLAGSRHELAEAYSASFVAERVRLLKELRRKLLGVLGTVWGACSVPGSPPLLKFSASSKMPDLPLPEEIPGSFSGPAAVRLSSAAIASLAGEYSLPKECHGPFKSALGLAPLLPLSPHLAQGTPLPGVSDVMLLTFPAPGGRVGGNREGGGNEGAAGVLGVEGHEVGALRKRARHARLFVKMLLAHYGRPGAVSRRWVEVTGVGLGVLVGASWVTRHRGDFSRWYTIARDAGTKFFLDHVWYPLLAVRDDVFLTFRPQKISIVDLRDVQQTQDSLDRMLMAYVASTARSRVDKLDVSPGGPPSRVELMQLMMSSYEQQASRPLQSLVAGHLAQAILIQVQQLKLHVESALLEMQKILRANEVNFAFLAALPALVLSLALASLARDWLYSESKGAEGRGRAAQIARRLCLGQVELLVLRHMGEPEVSQDVQGELVYSLFLLQRSVQREAQRTGEWASLQQDILELARPDLGSQVKAFLVARMSRLYQCLTVNPQRFLP